VLRAGRSVTGGEDEDGVGGSVVFEALLAEELRAMDPDMGKVTTVQSTLHQLHKLCADSRRIRKLSTPD
jgi:hypothetical protein